MIKSWHTNCSYNGGSCLMFNTYIINKRVNFVNCDLQDKEEHCFLFAQ